MTHALILAAALAAQAPPPVPPVRSAPPPMPPVRAATPRPAPPPLAAPAVAYDPGGFVGMLNAARAARGLAPAAVGDAAMFAAAAENNRLQAAHGLGHFFTGGFGQVAGFGIPDARAALDAWTGSPGHAALIYAPDLTAVAFHQLGGCVTASTMQGGHYRTPAAYAYRPR